MYPFNKIEKKWSRRWLREKTYEVNLNRAKRPFYNLMMFPYPSAEGLHVGNMYAFTGSDIYGRFQRMKGADVFEPIGLDGFGIHSENYALKIGVHPMKQAKISEKRFYRQLQMIGNGFHWSNRLETYNPEYYRWTQWIFLQLFHRGLAYRKKAPVNWCPSCKTVLADEQVIDGACERCDSRVVRKELEQWFFKITDYAERLLKNLDKIDWSEKVKIAQRHWIGKSEGALIKFPIQSLRNARQTRKNAEKSLDEFASVEVFTTRPDTIFGATYLVLAPEHPLIKNLQFLISNFQEVDDYIKKAKAKSEEERIAEGKEKTGVELKGIKAINPATKKEISIWVADYVLAGYGTGAIMAVPAHDERDFDFAKKYKLPIKMVVCPNYPEPKCPVLDRAYEGTGYLVDSGKFTGMPSEKAKWEITKFVSGKKRVQYHLRDWLISRQRYWGPPIPLVFCENCKKQVENSKIKIQSSKFSKGELENPGWIAVPEKDLPVKLPFVKDFRPKGSGVSPLATVKSFYEVKCPKCGSKARRETDVSDTFLDSAWYFLRYPSVHYRRGPFNFSLTRKWLPVDMYIGGAEHSVLHLLYARFITMALKDMKLIDFEEPFSVFRAHGLIIKEGAKMSKSKGNVVNPDEYIKKFGADALRLHLMFLGPFEEGGDFRDEAIVGVTRFLNRVWKLGLLLAGSSSRDKSSVKKSRQPKNHLSAWLHPSIKKISEDIAGLHYNTAIAELMIILNRFSGAIDQIKREDFETFLKMLAPFAPFITEELWERFGHKISIHLAAWPEYDERLVKQATIELVVQVNGRVRDKFEAEIGIKSDVAEALALQREKIKRILAGKKIKKVIFVPGKLLNIVTE